jgi:hypothetical protein
VGSNPIPSATIEDIMKGKQLFDRGRWAATHKSTRDDFVDVGGSL